MTGQPSCTGRISAGAPVESERERQRGKKPCVYWWSGEVKYLSSEITSVHNLVNGNGSRWSENWMWWNYRRQMKTFRCATFKILSIKKYIEKHGSSQKDGTRNEMYIAHTTKGAPIPKTPLCFRREGMAEPYSDVLLGTSLVQLHSTTSAYNRLLYITKI